MQQKMEIAGFEGRTSEWHEAALKPVRIHNIQVALNYYKMNPLDREGNYFHYEQWLKQVILLRGEGWSKYSTDERKNCNKLMEICEWLLEAKQIHKRSYSFGMGGQQETFELNIKHYKEFVNMLRQFEDYVKDLNDEHGLTGANREGHGGWD